MISCFVLLAMAGVGVDGGKALLAQQADEHLLVQLANQSRAAASVPGLKWDPALAVAAHAHALRMAEEGPISHRYSGEADLAQRAASAGARFSLIEENIAAGESAAQIHDGWMHSRGHHDNLLNPKIDRIGVALVSAHGALYAVADYAQGVEIFSVSQVEAQVGAIVHARGLALLTNTADARQYCAHDESPRTDAVAARGPHFLMRWQSADITHLPSALEDRIATGKYQQAMVGACAPVGEAGSAQAAFTAYRVAVLLY